MDQSRHVLICGECPLPGAARTHARIWEAVRCPTCQHFYCRQAGCLKRLDVKEEDSLITCVQCGTRHHYSGKGYGKICIDEPVAGIQESWSGYI